jgi:hypothetical protein
VSLVNEHIVNCNKHKAYTESTKLIRKGRLCQLSAMIPPARPAGRGYPRVGQRMHRSAPGRPCPRCGPPAPPSSPRGDPRTRPAPRPAAPALSPAPSGVRVGGRRERRVPGLPGVPRVQAWHAGTGVFGIDFDRSFGTVWFHFHPRRGMVGVPSYKIKLCGHRSAALRRVVKPARVSPRRGSGGCGRVAVTRLPSDLSV